MPVYTELELVRVLAGKCFELIQEPFFSIPQGLLGKWFAYSTALRDRTRGRADLSHGVYRLPDTSILMVSIFLPKGWETATVLVSHTGLSRSWSFYCEYDSTSDTWEVWRQETS